MGMWGGLALGQITAMIVLYGAVCGAAGVVLGYLVIQPVARRLLRRR